jgi:hypothetical protein
MRSALHYPASTSTSSGGFVESTRTAGLTSGPSRTAPGGSSRDPRIGSYKSDLDRPSDTPAT